MPFRACHNGVLRPPTAPARTRVRARTRNAEACGPRGCLLRRERTQHAVSERHNGVLRPLTSAPRTRARTRTRNAEACGPRGCLLRGERTQHAVSGAPRRRVASTRGAPEAGAAGLMLVQADPAAVMPEILRELPVKVQRVEMTAPSLEDVFLKLTGRGLDGRRVAAEKPGGETGNGGSGA